MSGLVNVSGHLPPTYQADATLNQANPVSGTKYTLLVATVNAVIYDILASITWTVQPDPLEIHVTIDGNERTYTLASPASATSYRPSLSKSNDPASITRYGDVGFSSSDLSTPIIMFQGRSITVTLESTGGTTSALKGLCEYGRW
jgi:hypothetical protein